ncbi:MAG: alkaline phosphatase family protein [Mariniblastus sp.]|nr:alkaline phosphatase family protein [Mariniblastus sp.]
MKNKLLKVRLLLLTFLVITGGDLLAQRIAVMEYPDRWTEQATGASQLLVQAGGQVVDVSWDRSPLKFGVDGLVFGSFCNNGPAFDRYVKRYQDDLREFVHQGGVILEMTQSDQMGDRVAWLPNEWNAIRGDADTHSVVVPEGLDGSHPLLKDWWPSGESDLRLATFKNKPLSWETFTSQKGFRVLLATKAVRGAPVLMEASWGRGRVVVTSLWLDKVYDPQSELIVPQSGFETSRKFFANWLDYINSVKTGKSLAVQPTPVPPELATGPMLGHLDSNGARVWYRPTAGGTYALLVSEIGEYGNKAETKTLIKESLKENDFCLTWNVDDLRADTSYSYEIRRHSENGPVVAGGGECQFRTDRNFSTPSQVSLAFGSCASSTEYYDIWQRIRDERVDGLVLLGDTPYINSSNLTVNREKHRQFLQIPTLAALGRNTPIWGTWDDHDFGGNDTDGNVPDKQLIRKAFTEYRAHQTFGDGQQGIYTRFRRGPIEVFLADARYFSQSEPSPVDPTKPTCLGKRQWEWLLDGLVQSTAPFKIIATGQIWDDKTNGEKDDWDTYAHERTALMKFIRDKKIEGVILMGGDIHASRALRYDDRVGYPLWQMIVSPMHASTIPSLNVDHPNLIWGEAVPNVFLRIVADDRCQPAVLVATWMRMDGKVINEVRLDASRLRQGSLSK